MSYESGILLSMKQENNENSFFVPDGVTNLKFADDVMVEKPDRTVHFEPTLIEFDYKEKHYKIPYTIGTPVDIVKLNILEVIKELV